MKNIPKYNSFFLPLSIMVVTFLIFSCSEAYGIQKKNTETGSSLSVQLTEHEKLWLSQPGAIKISDPRAFQPFSYFDMSGNMKGMTLDYIDFTIKQVGVHVSKAEDLPWPEAMRRAEERVFVIGSPSLDVGSGEVRGIA